MRHVALALVVLVAAGCSSSGDVAFAYGTVVAGEVTETVAAPASIQPRERSQVVAPTTGVVAELLVADGDDVVMGQVLLRLGSPSLAQQIAQAEAAVAAARSLGAVSTGTDLSPLLDLFADSLAGTVGAMLDALETQAAEIEDDEDRAAAQASLAEARSQYEQTLAGIRRAADDARASERAASAAQRAAAEAQASQAQVALDALRAQEGNLEVVAPVDGVVELARGGSPGAGVGDLAGGLDELSGLVGGVTTTSSAPLAEGSEVGAGQHLLTIFDLSGFHATAHIDEVDVIDVAVGQPAIVLVDALPDQQLRGRVDWIAVEPAEAGGGVTFDVVVALLEATGDLGLRVGLTASVEIDVATVSSDTVVPTSALLRRGGQEVVFVRRDGRAVEIPVTIRAIGLDQAAVTGELATGDEIVVRGVELLADGDELP